jgi:GTP cyclohydrolase FolE2
VIIILGLSGLKKEFHHRTSQQITKGTKEMIDIARSTNHGSDDVKTPPPILVVSLVIPVVTTCPDVLDMFDDVSARDLRLLVDGYEKNVYFVDAAPHPQLSPVDGIDFDEKAHENLALLMNKIIRNIFDSPC